MFRNAKKVSIVYNFVYYYHPLYDTSYVNVVGPTVEYLMTQCLLSSFFFIVNTCVFNAFFIIFKLLFFVL